MQTHTYWGVCMYMFCGLFFFFSLFLFIYLFIIVSTIGSLASMLRDAINANVCADYTIRASIVQIAEMLDFLDHLMEIGVLYFLSIKWWDVVLHVVIILVVRSIRSVISWCSVLRCDLIVFFFGHVAVVSVVVCQLELDTSSGRWPSCIALTLSGFCDDHSAGALLHLLSCYFEMTKFCRGMLYKVCWRSRTWCMNFRGENFYFERQLNNYRENPSRYRIG